jgi:hypothetical protein
MEENQQIKTENENDKVTLNIPSIIKIFFYIIGVISIFMAWKWYNSDLDVFNGNPYTFYEKSYVGGDAYNYIISASRSTAIMIKSLIWMVFGCSSLIIGLIFPKDLKQCK